MDVWKSQSDPARQALLAVGCVAVGLLLAIGFHDFDGPGMTNSKAGFLLGLMLLVIGGAGLLARGRQTVLVDPAARRIIIEDISSFGSRRRVILFTEITNIGIGYLGDISDGVTFYYLLLTLRDGEEYPLFAPGRFYEGASDRAVVEGWRQRLERCLWQ